ncbi:MAG: COG4315 family predicted lipoprotein [Actinomycetota bacterium]
MKPNRSAVALCVFALVVVACGGAGTTTTAAFPTETTTPEVTTATTTAPATTALELEVATTELGDVLADSEGFTLYVFMNDEAGVSNCTGACADNWLALSGDIAAGAGVDASLLGTTTRDDGSVQITYNGRPLYYFIGDTGPGEVNGQGVNEVWFVVDAAGEPVSA